MMDALLFNNLNNHVFQFSIKILNMKQNLLTLVAMAALLVPNVALAQSASSMGRANSGSENVSPFTQQSKRFNDWSISVGAGVPLMQSADMTSIKNGNGKNLFGYSAYVSIDKAITHVFGLNLQYDRGETRQGYVNTKDHKLIDGRTGGARTQYDAISILGDVNFSNLLRRVDNKSPYRWALHGYAGVGTLAYRAYRQDPGPVYNQALISEVKPFKFNSLFAQAGAGVKFKASSRIDIEARTMYVITGDDNFDGGGPGQTGVNLNAEQLSDNFFNTTLGVSLKLGKHQSHLMWHDPLQEIYYKLDVLADKNEDVEVCKKGDADNDGVCDDWDRQLDTPAGARVDGSGVALDVDLDGVIDLYDKCVTVPGPVENNGCPIVQTPTKVDVKVINETLKDILFDFNKATIKTESNPKLDQAAKIIKDGSEENFLIVGMTDKKGSVEINLNLSKQRAAAVVSALEARGVNQKTLKSIGIGSQEAVVPVTASDAERQADRRVLLRAISGPEWSVLEKNDIGTAKSPVKKTTKKVAPKKKK